MHTAYYIILIISTFLFAILLSGGLTVLLARLNMMAEPNDRSNHVAPVPTGVGLGFMIVAIGFLMVANAPLNVLLPALMLSIVSFLDDRGSLPVVKRLGFQAIAVIIAITSVKGSVFQGLVPYWLEAIILFGAWMWFINLYNFMDGIDEITINETVSITAGLMVLAIFTEAVPRSISIDASIILAAVLAFYPFNKHPAKAFMGDAGSVPLGFLLAYVLFNLAASGFWVAALILPAYYLCDASITLAKRAVVGKPIWQAHSEHYYQKAVRGGRSHAEVVRDIFILNIVLVALALISTFDPLASYVCLALAYGAVGVGLIRLTRTQIDSIPASQNSESQASSVSADVEAH